jgi:hypothetical protein
MEMNALLKSEVFLILVAVGLFTMAALYFTGDFNAYQEARNFFN